MFYNLDRFIFFKKKSHLKPIHSKSCFQTPAWLTAMIEHPTWRSLIYRLAEEYPDCLMLNFTIKVASLFYLFNFFNIDTVFIFYVCTVVFWCQLISDAGFQGEITSISTAAQQIEVFSRVLKTAISGFLTTSDDWQKSIDECGVCICNFFMLFIMILCY